MPVERETMTSYEGQNAQITRRRLTIAIAAAPIVPTAWAQGGPRRVAWFGAGKTGAPAAYLEAMRSGLRERGWEEGRNLAITAFFCDGTPEDAERVARQMIAANPEVIVGHGPEIVVLHRLKPPGPVVFAQSGDPTDIGLVQSFARPGGNFTGLSFMSLDLVGKRIEMLREAASGVRRLAVLARPEHPGEHRERKVSEAVALKLGMQVAYIPFRAPSELDAALQSVVQQHCDALVAFPDALMVSLGARIAAFALKAKIATVSGWSRFADSGFLMTYGPNQQAAFRDMARLVDRILRGAKPSELPVELPHILELVINARTARALGLAIPQSLLVRADRVIS